MPVIEASPVEIECILSASDTYIETLSVKQIEAQPWLGKAYEQNAVIWCGADAVPNLVLLI